MSSVSPSLNSLAGLDAPMVIHLQDHPSSSSHFNSSCCTSLRQSPLKIKAPVIQPIHTPSSGRTLELLPPVPTISSFQLSLILYPCTQSSSSLPSQAARSVGITHNYKIPSHHDNPNDPYTPWPQNIRPTVIPPPSSTTTVSYASYYSRPYSRTGARAPEPCASDASIRGAGCGIPCSIKWRKLKRNILLLSRRCRYFNFILKSRSVSRTSISSHNFRPSSVFSVALSITTRSSSVRSPSMSLTRDSFASWIERRNRASLEYTPSSGHESMDLSSYERRGSWLSDSYEASTSSESANQYSMNGAPPDDSEPVGKYYGLSLAAGQEAYRRRKARSQSSNEF